MRNQYNRYLVQSSGSGIMEAVVDPQSLVESEASSDYESDDRESRESSDEEDNKEGKPHSKKDSGRTPMSHTSSTSTGLIYELRKEVSKLTKEVNELTNELEEKKNSMNNLEKAFNAEHEEKCKFRDKNSVLEKEITSMNKQIVGKKKGIDSLRDYNLRLITLKAEYEETIENLKEQVKTLQEKISSMETTEEQQETLTRLLHENFHLKVLMEKMKTSVEKMKTSDKQKDETVEELRQNPSDLQNETIVPVQTLYPPAQKSSKTNHKPHPNTRKKNR